LIQRKPSRGEPVDPYVQRYADCSPTNMSGTKCPPRQKGERETARSGAMVFLPQLDMGTGEKGVLIANFDIDSAEIKSNLGKTIYWKQFLRVAGKDQMKWRLEGFSDCQGNEKGNQALRARRAKAVLAILPDELKGNITSADAAVTGDCITENSSAADRTLNRSVAFLLEESTYDLEGETIEGKLERKEPDTSGCSDEQRKRLAIAFPLAKNIGEQAMAAISGMKRGSPEAKLLEKFFGSRAFEERWHIKQNYNAALKAMAIGPTYKCVKQGTDPCEASGTVGYTGAHAIIFGNPTYACENAFYVDNIELADTILHEATHLGAWTADPEYCMPSVGCTKLETTDEVLPGIGISDRGALNNADSYSRFASELFRGHL
jgi:outer membrane protein OmpA-like peptidoglycan-associated protein